MKKFLDRGIMFVAIISFFAMITYGMFFSDLQSLTEIRGDWLMITLIVLTVASFCGVFISIARGRK